MGESLPADVLREGFLEGKLLSKLVDRIPASVMGT